MEEVKYDNTNLSLNLEYKNGMPERILKLGPQKDGLICLSKGYRSITKRFEIKMDQFKDEVEVQKEIDNRRAELVEKYIKKYGRKRLIGYKFDFDSYTKSTERTSDTILQITLTLVLDY